MSGKLIDVVQRVKEGTAYWDWETVISEHQGHKLYIRVFADAMKFDDVPPLTWNYQTFREYDESGEEVKRTYNGVRLPASAQELQQIADLTSCMLLTPKVVDLIWLQAKVKFDPVINSGPSQYQIVAEMPIVGRMPYRGTTLIGVHELIQEKIDTTSDGTGLVASVGKYWVLTNGLGNTSMLRFGDETACNYGWCSSSASGPGVTPGVQCWQRPGYAHDIRHWDPSQVIRLMFRTARLVRADGTEEYVDLGDIAQDPELGPLITHEGELGILRQPGVEELPAMQPIQLPPETIIANPWRGA